MDASSDRVRIDYTSAVDKATRKAVVDAVEAIVTVHGYYLAQHYDKSLGAWAVDVTSYDPTIIKPKPVSNEQAIDILKQIAQEKGISVARLLQEIS